MPQQGGAFDIAAGRLDAARVHFARQSGLSVDAPPLRPRTISPVVDAQFGRYLPVRLRQPSELR